MWQGLDLAVACNLLAPVFSSWVAAGTPGSQNRPISDKQGPRIRQVISTGREAFGQPKLVASDAHSHITYKRFL